jgi:hypothetical protein
MKTLFFMILSMISYSSFALNGDFNLSPASLKIKLYKMAVSTDPLCSNLITVFDNGSNSVEVDLAGTLPTIGTGLIADGSYNCIAIEMSDLVKYTPSTNSTSLNCNTSVQNTLDMCQLAYSGTSKLIDGSAVTCGISGTDDKVVLYMSTSSSGYGTNIFTPPTSSGDALHGVLLASPLVINGTTVGKLEIATTGKICDANYIGCIGTVIPKCVLRPPTFTYLPL